MRSDGDERNCTNEGNKAQVNSLTSGAAGSLRCVRIGGKLVHKKELKIGDITKTRASSPWLSPPRAHSQVPWTNWPPGQPVVRAA